MAQKYVPPTYPVLAFIARMGTTLALVAGAATLVAGAWIAYATQLWYVLPVAALAAVVLAGLLASYVELARIVIDTLVPR
jgi:hypothetical protein